MADRENGKRNRFWMWLLLVFVGAAILCFFTGCKNRGGESQEKERSLSMKREELMLIVATERNRYEQIYTGQIWGQRCQKMESPSRNICWSKSGCFQMICW